jgi:hypothetical protein
MPFDQDKGIGLEDNDIYEYYDYYNGPLAYSAVGLDGYVYVFCYNDFEWLGGSMEDQAPGKAAWVRRFVVGRCPADVWAGIRARGGPIREAFQWELYYHDLVGDCKTPLDMTDGELYQVPREVWKEDDYPHPEIFAKCFFTDPPE